MKNYDVVFATHRGYQAREIALVARALNTMGISTACLVSHQWREQDKNRTIFQEGLDPIPWDSYADSRVTARALVIRSEVYLSIQDLISRANREGIPTIALTHPVINFTRFPDPYPYSHHLLCAGPFTARRMSRGKVQITGFPGLEDLSRTERRSTAPHVLVNLKSDHVGANWMQEIAAACRAVGIPFSVCVHPADQGKIGDWPVDPRPLYEQLPEATVVISLPSTVLLEALLMGIPCICHRSPLMAPWEMDTFDDPLGAFENTEGEADLSSALRKALNSEGSVQQRAALFIAEHVSVNAESSATQRVTGAIQELVR